MNKIILSGLVASAIFTSAVAEEFYITPTIGKAIRESSDLEKDSIFGVRVGMPMATTYGTDTVELAYDRQNSVGYNGIADSTSINRFSGNALKHYNNFGVFTPYALVGAGFEHITNDKLSTDNSLFVNVGAGIKYKLQNNMSLMTDVRHIVRLDEFDSHTIWNVGLVIPLSNIKSETVTIVEPKKAEVKKAEPVVAIEPKKVEPIVIVEPKKPEPIVVVEVKQPEPVVEVKKIDEIEPEPVIVKVAPIDSDGDGVIDTLDKCPNTPAGFTVDANGCEVSYKLKINFDTNKVNIKPEYEADITKFVLFMKTFGNYKAEIQGHTDNRGNAKSNKSLSQKRADSLKERFVNDGISADRLTAIGYGDEKPVASNDTVEGQNANRRIDINLSK